MSIFDKPVDKLTIEDVLELCPEEAKNRAQEGLRLEFVSQYEGPQETLKKICGFANTIGGWIVIGAADDDRSGRITALPGADAVPGIKQQVTEFCFSKVYPAVTAFVSDPLEITPGRYCYVIHVPESPNAPHYINDREGVWVRVDEYSKKSSTARQTVRASDSELERFYKKREDKKAFRESILERSKRRYTIFRDRKLGETNTNVTSDYPIRYFFASPIDISTYLIEESEMQKAFDRTEIYITQPESLISTECTRYHATGANYIERTVRGSFFSAGVGLKPLTGKKSVNLYGLCVDMYNDISATRQLFNKLGYEGSVLINYSLTGILGFEFLYSDRSSAFGTQGISLFDDSISIERVVDSETLRTKQRDVFKDIVKQLFFALGLYHQTADAYLDRYVDDYIKNADQY